MAYYSATVTPSSIRGLVKGKLSCDSQRPSAYIHILEDDSLLNIFLLCRPALLEQDKEDAVDILGGRKWDDERWWFRLVQVCRRWRYLVLESASLLGLSLLCTYGTPVKDMLAHLPPLPLILDYCDLYDYITPDDEQDIILALERRDRVRRIRIMQPVYILERLIKALRGEFLNLEYLFIERHMFYLSSTENNDVAVDIPETFLAPRLRYLMVTGLRALITSRSLMTMGNLVTLSLNFDIPSWVYLHPNPLLQQLSHTPRLETPGNTDSIYFKSPSVDMECQLLRRAAMRRVTPYLRRFGVQGANAYLEALLPRVTIRLLEKLQLYFLDQLKRYLILSRRHILSYSEAVYLESVELTFLGDHLRVDAFSHDSGFGAYRFSMSQGGKHLDRQLTSVTQLFQALGTVFSPAEHLILRYKGPPLIPSSESEWNSEADRTQWRELFGMFGNLKALYVNYALVGKLSRFLRSEGLEGESPTTDSDMLLPELRDLWYSVPNTSESDEHSFFIEFTRARRNAGRPVKLFQAVIPSLVN